MIRVIPRATNATGPALSPVLRQLAPASEPLLHLQTPAEIESVLVSGELEGWSRTIVDFNEDDAAERACGLSKWFVYASEEDRQREFSSPRRAGKYLDLFYALEKKNVEPDCGWDTVRTHLLLPDGDKKPTLFSALHAGVVLPAGFPELATPPVVHPDLLAHPLLRKASWRRSRFTHAVPPENRPVP